jgi:hypothetical protein
MIHFKDGVCSPGVMETIEQQTFEAPKADRYGVIGDQRCAPGNCDSPCGKPRE